MPLHDYRCPKCGKVSEIFTSLENLYTTIYACEICPPHVELERVFLTAPASFMQRDVCYDSPIDGRVITTAQARKNDLARSECIPYEPGMKQDAARHKLERDQQLDKSVDSSVDQFFATAGSRKLEKLEQELRAGATVEVKRDSPATTT